MISVTAVNNRLYSYGKSNYALTPSQKTCYIENRGKRLYFIAYARINLFHSSYWII